MKPKYKGPLGGRHFIAMVDALEKQGETWLVTSEHPFGSRERFLETRARIATYERHGTNKVKAINVSRGALFVRINE